MRGRVLIALLTAGTGAMASEPGCQLSIETRMQDSVLTVTPQIAADAGRTLRYDMVTSKQGGSGKSDTHQRGIVTVDHSGKAALSKVSVSVREQERYLVTVHVYDGARLVASQSVRLPD